MLGRLNPQIREAVVIGAGYAGLITAYRLLQNGYSVTVHEKSVQIGGLISTFQTEYGPVETAAHSIRSSPEIVQLFADLNLPYVQARSKKKYIYRDGRFRKNPLTLWEMFRGGCYAGFKKSDGRFRTLADWTRDHIGPGALEAAITPLAHGIYAAEPEELDQQLAFPRMTIPEGQTFVDKVFKNKTPKENSFVMAPQGGMGELTKRLTDIIGNHRNGLIILNSEISTLPDADNIIVTAPAAVAGKLIGSPLITGLQYTPMVTATVFLKASEIRNLEGIGILMARGEDRHILGILFNSATFVHRAAQGYVSLTIMLGGTTNPGILDATDQLISQIIHSELSRILDLKSPALSIHITKWHNAIPLYSSELRAALNEAVQNWCAAPGHILFANYTGEVSIRGMCSSSLALVSNSGTSSNA